MSDADNGQFHGVILDSISDGVFTVDPEWRITSFNRGAQIITGIPCHAALGKPCREVLRASICEHTCALRTTLATGRPVVNRAIQIRGRRDEPIPVSISTGVFRDREGNVLGGVETFRDLSLSDDLRHASAVQQSFPDIIGRSRAMRPVLELLPLLADSDSTVLIEGASGTGKELFAQAIHRLSRRKDRPFVAINCGALPDTLLESELFGYKAGAFTDARQDKPGRFAMAEGGTILLDEICDISPAMQTRLLRVLQQREFEPLGAVAPEPVDVRILAATNRDLSEMVRSGQFREDLYYRIHVIRLALPPLCDRREDIPLLVEHLIAKFNRAQNKQVVGVDDEVLAVLMNHDYPGNVRELENIIEHAFVLCQGGLLLVAHLPAFLQSAALPSAIKRVQGLTLREMEELLIRDALRRHQGHRRKAAAQLGIDPSTLFRKMKALGIAEPRVRPR